MLRASIRHLAGPARHGGSPCTPRPPGSSQLISCTWTRCCSNACTCLVFIEHGSRRMHLGGVTAHPSGDRTAQQARNLAFTLGAQFEDIRFLIRDRGSNFTASFDAVFQGAGTRIVRALLSRLRG